MKNKKFEKNNTIFGFGIIFSTRQTGSFFFIARNKVYKCKKLQFSTYFQYFFNKSPVKCRFSKNIVLQTPSPPSNFPKISIHTLWGTLLRIIMVRNLAPPQIIFAHPYARRRALINHRKCDRIAIFEKGIDMFQTIKRVHEK